MKYFIVGAFTQEPFGGNPAAVVLLEHGTDFPAARWMQQVAAEFRYSETAFVQRNGSAEFTVRFFTPCGEVDLCGHATIATYSVLLHTGAVQQGAVCRHHTLAGDLEVRAEQPVMMQMAQARVMEGRIDLTRLHRIMTQEQDTTWPHLPVEIISTGLPDIMMPVSSVQELHRLRPDMEVLAQLSRELGVTGVHAFALGQGEVTAHVRNFGPLYGIPEESATGTANAALTHYLRRHGIIASGARCRFVQGEAMGRPSVVTTALDGDDIYVGGHSRIVARGDLLV